MARHGNWVGYLSTYIQKNRELWKMNLAVMYLHLVVGLRLSDTSGTITETTTHIFLLKFPFNNGHCDVMTSRETQRHLRLRLHYILRIYIYIKKRVK